MNEKLIIRYGDLCLKGKNRKYFIKEANNLIKEKIRDLDVSFKYYGERVYIDTKQEPLDKVIERLNKVSGLNSYSIYERCSLSLDEICEMALDVYDKYHIKGESFKVDVRRVNKMFPLESIDLMKKVGGYIYKNRDDARADVHNPDLTIFIEIREDGAYILSHKFDGMGGFPTGTGGKALVMMSGGIDSPVASYELIKQGMTIELIHFESTPLTSIESAQKVIDLSKKLCDFTKGERIVVHLVPFTKVHQEILSKVDETYLVTIMRRCMYRIAEGVAKLRKIKAIANGESLGQVASQTVESMYVINSVTTYPILRPLLTIDKRDIIKISKKIDTYDISIRPFEDCCTVYVPKNPVIKPSLKEARYYESLGDFDNLIEEAIKETSRIVITKDTDITLSLLGFTVKEAIDEYRREENV